MSTGRVIGSQRFGKVTKNANDYHQVWHVNLETLFVCCLWKLRQYKTKTKDCLSKKNIRKKKLQLIWCDLKPVTLCRNSRIVRKETVSKSCFRSFALCLRMYVCTCAEKIVKLCPQKNSSCEGSFFLSNRNGLNPGM